MIPSAKAMFCVNTDAVCRLRLMKSAILRGSSHDGDIGGFHRGSGASRSHRKADVGTGDGRSIVDAVPYHANFAIFCFQFRHARQDETGHWVAIFIFVPCFH